MLMKLSIRNAKRQYKEYSLYFITLISAVSFMYAFNSLIFSDSVKALPNTEVLSYSIVAASILIVLVIGWVIGYMANYMLKRRSRELSVYMLSGIQSRAIGKMLFYETALLGLFALLLGLPVGMLLSQLLEAIVLRMYGSRYTLHFKVPLPAVGLTGLYFLLMLLRSMGKGRKWIRRASLRELLYYERENEESRVSGKGAAPAILLMALLAGGIGLIFLLVRPLGKGYDILIGVICLALFVFGFFKGLSGWLAVRLDRRTEWKYEKNRLVVFRGFTAKIRSAGTAMGMLSVLFMLAMTFMGIGAAVTAIADKNLEDSVFDIMILHSGKMPDSSKYEEEIGRLAPIKSSHSYGVYTDEGTAILALRDQAVSESGRTDYAKRAEFRSDTYIRQSDYLKLREMLGYEELSLDPMACYVHCVPALARSIAGFLQEDGALECAGYSYAAEVFTEPFSQLDVYGNGLDYIIVVPDDAAGQLKLLYGLYSAITEAPLDSDSLNRLTEGDSGLTLLRRNVGKTHPSGKGTTSLIDDVDYLIGKWVDKEQFTTLYAMAVCLFYLALILEITGAAILASQVLSDREKRKEQNLVLRRLGMDEKRIAAVNGRELSMLFFLPPLPAVFISGSFVYMSADKMQQLVFHLPVFENGLWVMKPFGISLLLFAGLYGIYYIAARNSYGR